MPLILQVSSTKVLVTGKAVSGSLNGRLSALVPITRPQRHFERHVDKDYGKMVNLVV